MMFWAKPMVIIDNNDMINKDLMVFIVDKIKGWKRLETNLALTNLV